MSKNLTGNFYAAVDIGTNSFHMIIIQVNEDGSFKIVDREREVVRLGSEKGDNLSFITDEESERAVSVLAGFKKLSASYNAEIRAVATSAVRESKNGMLFVQNIFEKTGIKIEIIDGREEAKLIYLGIQKALPVSDKKVLCIDIGGGSTEFILADKSNIIFAESIKVGAVRLTKMFFPDFILTGKAIKQCEDYIEEEILSNINLKINEPFEAAVGTSGTIQSAARIIYNLPLNNSINELKLSYDDLKIVTSTVFRKRTKEERIKIPGLEEKRADIIPAGLLILNKAFKIFNIKEILISEFALREGIISDMLTKNLYKH